MKRPERVFSAVRAMSSCNSGNAKKSAVEIDRTLFVACKHIVRRGVQA
jgi:hypothetical protein